jgi:nicotinamidase-related amidase
MLRASNAALVVIDIQDKLLPRREGAAAAVIAKTQKLVQAAKTLGIPVLVTEQNPGKIGPTAAPLAETLGETPRIGKMEFGCLNNPDFRAALEATRRRQLLLTGVEAHICVLQTALGAQEMGYTPFVVRDAVASLDPAEEEAGLRRMERHGTEIVTTQMAMFELLGAAGTPEFKQLLPILK